MWLDVEEEQEFAWLMSDFTFADVWSAAGDGSLGAVEVLYEEDGQEEEEVWGMKPLTSVLSLQSANKANKAKGKDKGKTKLPVEVATLPPINVVRPTPRPDHTPNPWSVAPRSTAQAVQVPPPLLSRAVSPASIASTTSTKSASVCGGSGGESDKSDKGNGAKGRNLSSSPPRERNRPPPLRLVERARNPHLPTVSRTPLPESATLPLPPRLDSLNPLPPVPSIRAGLDNTKLSRPALAKPVKSTSTSTSRSATSKSKNHNAYGDNTPKTPFVHPRQAPKPSTNIHPMPVDTRPTKGASKEKDKSTRPTMQRSESGGSDRSREGVSFFEPVTPTVATGKKTRWLKKVVNLGSR